MKFGLCFAFGFACLTLWQHSSNADGFDSYRSRADKHAPASIMGDHLHDPGEWMVEYKYMNMYMEDNRAGTRTLSDAGSFTYGDSSTPVTNQGATPTQMTHEMHMLHIMRGVTEDITVYTMLMLPSITMDHQRRGDGSAFTTHNSGFGDTTFGALLRLYSDVNDDLILNLAGSVPTGDIFRTTRIPSRGVTDQALPYPMRLGSGTFNAKPGITWKHYLESGSWGVQFQSDVPIGRNYRDYSVSDEFRLNTWYSHLLTDNFSTSIRLENLWRTNYDGADAATPDAMISTNVESFRGGYSLNLGLGAAALVKGHLLNVEFVPTLYQDLDGIQLETDWTMAASWSKSF
ncbi:Putative MetA-pathway of phenol degradation [Neorhodopirellula lusitana]|uniref:MetA-pathway of phenol degradation n=1 Tax=Neorhodopirellula lusitana TaxID=445327 RepID=A0ABY1PZY7_9BACT|nr:transporter [Neorhodopirellula lusitana]SMP52008.1 Putative MetA-pathway of phenol degradation [Neorhodopirellula lusitana]